MKIVQNQSLKEKLTVNSIEKARSSFTIEVMLYNYEKVIKEVLNENSKNNL